MKHPSLVDGSEHLTTALEPHPSITLVAAGASFDPETITLLKKVLAEAERTLESTPIIGGQGQISHRHP